MNKTQQRAKGLDPEKTYRTMFLIRRKNASRADVQKFLPYIATWKDKIHAESESLSRFKEIL